MVPPNPRVQRTRSSPSARSSPLTRHPLGRGKAGAALVIGLAGLGASCVTVDGKGYWAWAWPPSPSTVRCEPTKDGGGSLVRASVTDEQGRPFPGATVIFAGEGAVEARRVETSADGIASAWLSPGGWKVEAELPGFRQGSQALSLEPDHMCDVIFNLLPKEPAR